VAKHPVDTEDAYFNPGKGLTFNSKDGQFSLATRLRAQNRFTIENESGSPADLGLIIRRARLQFLGHAFGEHNTFKAEIALSPRDLRMTRLDSNTILRESPLLDWYMEFDYIRDLTLRVGQYKLPFSRQRVISSGNLQMVDRSIANAEFNLDRDVGLDIRSEDFLGFGHFRYYLGIFNGEGRSPFASGNSDLLYTARVEVLPLGMFKDYSEADFERLSRPGISLGLAYALAPDAGSVRLNQGGAPDDAGTTDVQALTADVMFKYMGLSIFSEIFWREGDRNPGAAVDEFGVLVPVEEARDGIGWFAQAGYLLPRMPVEVAGRYGQIRADDESSLSDSNEAGLAVSYYFAQHPFKLQADAFQLWEDEFSDGTTVGRVQLQLAY